MTSILSELEMINWSTFAAAFSFIFLAALPGRTTFLMVIMAARQRPLGIFLGSGLAFVCQSAISVLLGHFIAFLPAPWIQFGTGVLFIFFAYLIWRKKDNPEQLATGEAESKLRSQVRSSFILIFAAEWGDISQIAIASFAARSSDQLTVFISAITALLSIAGAAVLLGSRVSKLINPKIVQKIAATAFIAIGLYLISSSVSLLFK